MERIVSVIVRAVGAEEARRKIDNVVNSEKKMAAAAASVNASQQTYQRLMNTTAARIDKVRRETDSLIRSMKKLSRAEADMHFMSSGPQFGAGRNRNPFFTGSGPGMVDPVPGIPGGGGGGGGRGRGNQVASGILGLFGAGGRQVLGATGGAMRTLLGSLGQLAGASTAASMAIGGTVGMLLTWPVTLGGIVMLGKGVKDTFSGIMDVFDGIYQSAIGEKIKNSFEAVVDAVGPLTDTVMKSIDPTGRLQEKLEDLFDKVGAWGIAVLPGVIVMFEKIVDVMLFSIRAVARVLAGFGDTNMLQFVDALELTIAQSRFQKAAEERFPGEHLKTPLPVITDDMKLAQKKDAYRKAWEESRPMSDEQAMRDGLGESEAMRERALEKEKKKEELEKGFADTERLKEKKQREQQRAELEAERNKDKAHQDAQRLLREEDAAEQRRQREEDRKLRDERRKVDYEELNERRRKLGLQPASDPRQTSRYDIQRIGDSMIGYGY